MKSHPSSRPPPPPHPSTPSTAMYKYNSNSKDNEYACVIGSSPVRVPRTIPPRNNNRQLLPPNNKILLSIYIFPMITTFPHNFHCHLPEHGERNGDIEVILLQSKLIRIIRIIKKLPAGKKGCVCGGEN